jgi:predicted ribosome quality control (RQC) complex YloA/Tae2 family protein
MEYEKKIQLLLSENEFLQQQLEDLNNEIRKKEEEISLLGDMSESESSLRSRIDSNLIEIEQLKYNSELATQKSIAIEMMNEELEVNLLKEIRGRHKEQAVIKKLSSVNTNIDILNNELNEAAALYKKVQSLKKELAEAKSIAEIKTLENNQLVEEIAELKELLTVLKTKKNT